MSLREAIIEKAMEPHNCANCEFNAGEQGCLGGDNTKGHAYGHNISDTADTCRGWSPDCLKWADVCSDLEAEGTLNSFDSELVYGIRATEIEKLIRERIAPQNCGNCYCNVDGICQNGNRTKEHKRGHKIVSDSDTCGGWFPLRAELRRAAYDLIDEGALPEWLREHIQSIS